MRYLARRPIPVTVVPSIRLAKFAGSGRRRSLVRYGAVQAAGAGDNCLQLAGASLKPVHFPIASDQRTARHRFGPKILRHSGVSRPVACGKGAFYL